MKQFIKFFTAKFSSIFPPWGIKGAFRGGLFAALFPLWGLGGFAQAPPITIKWTAELNGEHYPLDSVVITNQSNGETMTVYYDDTIFVYQNLGINELPVTRNTLRVSPNPFSNSTQVEFSLARGGEADLAVYDVLGREILRKVSVLESGTHSYKLSLPQGFYTLRLQTAEGVRTARVVSEGNCLNHDFQDFRISRINNLVNLENLEKIVVQTKGVRGGLHKANNTNFPCQHGDTLVLQGFITQSDSVLTEEHSLPLTKDAFVTFAFCYPISIPFTEYSLESTDCQWENFPPDTLIVINSNAELENYITCTDYPPIDFNLYSLLLVRGTTDYGTISEISKNYVQLCSNKYKLNVGINLQDTSDSEQWLAAILVPKVSPSAVSLNVYYPHVEVWEYTRQVDSTTAVTITLTLDTLQKKYYVSVYPKDLSHLGIYEPKFYFHDGDEGKYGFYKLASKITPAGDTIFLDIISFGKPMSTPFVITMFSLDSMLLEYGGIIVEPFNKIYNYLFIKQNF